MFSCLSARNCLLLIVTVLLLSSCNDNKKFIDKRLRETINKYFEYQKLQNWDATYDMRPPEFRSMVERNYYKEEMSKDSVGWDLINYKIEDVANNNDTKVKLLIKFTYKINIKNSHTNIRNQSFLENTEWIKISNIWYCYNAGYQYHLPLNDSINR
jgi:phage pi2 protein 07